MLKSSLFSFVCYFNPVDYNLNQLKMSKRWLRYGLVGNFLSYGVGVGFMLYLGWIIYDIGETNSTKMDEELAKEFFTFTDSELKESARKAKINFQAKKEQKLRRHQANAKARQEQNKRAEYI